MTKHRKIYQLLKKNGHTPAGANDVLVDARRKKGKARQHARMWIGLLFSQRAKFRV